MNNYTNEQLQDARSHAAQINYDLASHAFDDDFGFASHITQADKQRYVEEEVKMAKEIETGLHDHNFTIWQRMNTYLTGECVAFLP